MAKSIHLQIVTFYIRLRLHHRSSQLYDATSYVPPGSANQSFMSKSKKLLSKRDWFIPALIAHGRISLRMD